jgi:hypothetical protein
MSPKGRLGSDGLWAKQRNWGEDRAHTVVPRIAVAQSLVSISFPFTLLTNLLDRNTLHLLPLSQCLESTHVLASVCCSCFDFPAADALSFLSEQIPADTADRTLTASPTVSTTIP